MNDSILPQILYYLVVIKKTPISQFNDYSEKIGIRLDANGIYCIDTFDYPEIECPQISHMLSLNKDDVNEFYQKFQKKMLIQKFKESEFYDLINELIDEKIKNLKL
jgi:hypothetical protein